MIAIIRTGMRAMLELEPDMDVIGEAEMAGEAVDRAAVSCSRMSC